MVSGLKSGPLSKVVYLLVKLKVRGNYQKKYSGNWKVLQASKHRWRKLGRRSLEVEEDQEVRVKQLSAQQQGNNGQDNLHGDSRIRQ